MKITWKKTAEFIGRHWILIAFLIFVVGMIMTPYRLERMFVYFPTRQVHGNPGTLGLAYEDVSLATADGVKLHGWFIPHAAADTTLLIFHGNAGNIGDRLPWIEVLHALRVHILIMDYRGYGKSEGKPFEAGLYRDAQAAYAWWARKREAKGEKLVLFGESLGGAVAVNLAAKVSPAGLILQSTFTSGWDMAKIMFPVGLLQPLLNVHFDSETAIVKIHCPKLLIHGTQDEVVPFRLGKKLFDAAPSPKSFYAVPGAGHNDLIEFAGDEYLQRVELFLSHLKSLH